MSVIVILGPENNWGGYTSDVFLNGRDVSWLSRRIITVCGIGFVNLFASDGNGRPTIQPGQDDIDTCWKFGRIRMERMKPR